MNNVPTNYSDFIICYQKPKAELENKSTLLQCL